MPSCDAATENALYTPSVECGEDWWVELCSPQSPQEEEMPMGFLGDKLGVEGPCQVLCDVNTKELRALDNLHLGR